MAHPVNVIVEHDYTAADDVELTIRRGDVITNVEKKEGGWWRGELRGRVGLFPDNFVKPQDDVVLRNNSPRYCRALFSYKACNPDELNLAVGDTIQILGEVEEGWWKGQRGKLMGVFPSNFVIPLEETPPLPPKPVREQCKVIFPYTAANADELTLVEGDILTIISKDVADVGWWRGEHQGKSGLFPDNFVTILPVQSEGSDKKSLRSIKHLPSTVKSHTSSLNKKDSHSSGQENVAAVRKSLEPIDNHIYDPISSKFKKSMDSNESNLDSEKHKLRKSHDGESASETKSRRTLDVDNAGAKPPIPAKKAGSPVAAMFIGLRQKVFAVEQRLSGGQQSSDTADGAASSKSSGEPILTSISPSPSPVPPIINTTSSVDQAMSESFDQVERGSMLNDLRSGRVKGPPRRPPSQTTRDDAPLTNGNSNHNSSTESASETEIKPKTREWEKHKAPWMEELKQNQAKKTSPIGDIGRSKTVSSTDSSTNEVSQSRLSSSSDKIIESGESETLNDVLVNDSLEMSQSMSSLSSKAIKIDTSTEVQNQAENPQDMSKSLLSMSTRGSHIEMNNKVSSNELRTSISSSASVILRSTTHSANPSPYSQTSSINSSQIYKNLPPISPEIKVSTSIPIPNPAIDEGSLPNTANGITYPDMTPEQLLIQQLNERVANLERVVETQEKILATLSAKLNRESELRVSLQAEIQKLERCVTRV